MSFLIIANWKMNGTRPLFADFINKLNNYISKVNIQLVICPPFTLFPDKVELNNNISLGAQNCHYKESGSYTGEISVNMLKELGCTHVILGHSERKEADSDVKFKAETALRAGLHPIICVGESLDDYKKKRTKIAIEHQCEKRFPKHGEYIVAYEPTWAIGTDCTPSIEAISEVLTTINLYAGKRHAVYGGSVNSQNIEKFLDIPALSGVLVGSASLNVDQFYALIQQCYKYT